MFRPRLAPLLQPPDLELSVLLVELLCHPASLLRRRPPTVSYLSWNVMLRPRPVSVLPLLPSLVRFAPLELLPSRLVPVQRVN